MQAYNDIKNKIRLMSARYTPIEKRCKQWLKKTDEVKLPHFDLNNLHDQSIQSRSKRLRITRDNYPDVTILKWTNPTHYWKGGPTWRRMFIQHGDIYMYRQSGAGPLNQDTHLPSHVKIIKTYRGDRVRLRNHRRIYFLNEKPRKLNNRILHAQSTWTEYETLVDSLRELRNDIGQLKGEAERRIPVGRQGRRAECLKLLTDIEAKVKKCRKDMKQRKKWLKEVRREMPNAVYVYQYDKRLKLHRWDYYF